MTNTTNSPTWYFNLHWTNDQELYLAVLDHARTLLRKVPGMTDQTLGRNIRDAVQRWCADGHAEALGWQEVSYRISPSVLAMMAEEVGDFGAVSETAVGEEVRELLGEEDGDQDDQDSPPLTNAELQSYAERAEQVREAQRLLNTNPWDRQRERGISLELLNMPGETMGFAMAEHDGDLYVICTEGVGWLVTEAKPLALTSSPLSPDQVRERRTGELVDLADHIRTFGDRLESNFWLWSRKLTTTQGDVR